ncbi:MAG: FAD-binding oxidoreductase [Neisseriaceae bacterium]|nr:MAG: FAD-binding oxidoreductase [Neisseriaceae bacterium]
MPLQTFVTRLKNIGFKGDICLDTPTRLLNATDNSIYEVLPQAVVQPKDSRDVELLLQTANTTAYKELKFCARGGGTGTNGQSLTQGIVIDFSKYMNKIIDVDVENKTALVEPGMILSDLNRHLAQFGLFFAPNVSTADRATIGGMIATDAAGKGSLIYGKTSDHLKGLQFYLADGTHIDTIRNHCPNEIEQNLVSILDPVQDEIARVFPEIKRPLSGYDIKRCYQEGKVRLEYLVAGSEGTLGLVTAAKINLLPIPKFKALMVVHYNGFVEALRDAEFLIKFQPLAIEAIDEKVQKSAQTLPNWTELAKLLDCEGKSYISNFVEFVADTEDELKAKLTEVTTALNNRNSIFVTVKDNVQINQLWSIRSLAVGLVAKLPGARKPIAFVEDAIVPPENLADFVEELQSTLDKQSFTYAMYGHVDVGCIHVRPALDMQQTEDRAHIRPITEQVIQLLDKYNGILWGEHGKGYRGEFVPHVFGEKLYPILCQIKQLFDPTNKFNPGKLTAPSVEIKLQRIEEIPMRGQFDQVVSEELQKDYANAMLCNGNGACFNKEPSNVMCPSYKVTNDRIHSPKGRATLVKEWLRNKSTNNPQTKQSAQEAYDAIMGCLGCKACSGKCPTQVSIPDLRTKFLDAYHSEYKKRKLRDVIMGNVEKLIPVAHSFKKISNSSVASKLLSLLGISNLPKFENEESISDYVHKNKIDVLDEYTNVIEMPKNSVVIFSDVFNGYFDTIVIKSFIEVLKKIGFIPYVILPRESGKALIWNGYIKKFKQASFDLSVLLNPLFMQNRPVIALDNTITTLFSDETVKFARQLVGKVQSISAFLSTNLANQTNVSNVEAKYRLLTHCTEQALIPSEASNWQKIFKNINAELEVKNLGCCGMAGTYGHISENSDNARKLYEMNWQKTMQDEAKINLATGFSCRSQSKIYSNRISHPIEIINQIIQ